MEDFREILVNLNKKKQELTAQLEAVNGAIQHISFLSGVTLNLITPSTSNQELYSSDFPMDKKIYFILKEIKEGTVIQIEEAIKRNEPNSEYEEGHLNKAVSMAVSRLHTVGNTKYILSNKDGKIKSKPDPTDSRRRIYYL
jgi:hypothetical protein